jgi:hypothetical protein
MHPMLAVLTVLAAGAAGTPSASSVRRSVVDGVDSLPSPGQAARRGTLSQRDIVPGATPRVRRDDRLVGQNVRTRRSSSTWRSNALAVAIDPEPDGALQRVANLKRPSSRSHRRRASFAKPQQWRLRASRDRFDVSSRGTRGYVERTIAVLYPPKKRSVTCSVRPPIRIAAPSTRTLRAGDGLRSSGSGPRSRSFCKTPGRE